MRGHIAGTSCSDQVPSTSEMKVIVRWTNFAAEIQFISQESHSFFYFRGVTTSYCVAPIGHRKFDNNNYSKSKKCGFSRLSLVCRVCVLRYFFTVDRYIFYLYLQIREETLAQCLNQIYLFLQIAIFPPREIVIFCLIHNSPARKLSASRKNHSQQSQVDGS